MDWTKAKNMLIVIFLMVNVILFSIYYNDQREKYTLSQGEITRISTLLLDHNIVLYERMPPFYPMSKLQMQVESMEEKQVLQGIFAGEQKGPYIESLGKKYLKGREEVFIYQNGLIDYSNPDGRHPLKSLEKKEVEKSGKKFLKDLTGGEPEYQLDLIEEKNHRFFLEYHEVYKGQLLFNSYVKMEVSKKGVEKAYAFRYKPLGFIEGKRTLRSPDEILLNFMNEIRKRKDSDELIVVKNIDIGYHIGGQQPGDDISGIAVPYYRIIFGDGERVYINAYNNEIRQTAQENLE